jgi:hypothetical protein
MSNKIQNPNFLNMEVISNQSFDRLRINKQ